MELTKDDTVWPASNADERLRMAYVDFRRMCGQSGVRALPVAVWMLFVFLESFQETGGRSSQCSLTAFSRAMHGNSDS